MKTLASSLLVALFAAACGSSSHPSPPKPPAPSSGVTNAQSAGGEPITPEQNATSHATAKKILGAAAQWTATHAEGACPSVAQLKADGALSAMAMDTDAWGRPFLLICAEGEAIARSDGPDLKGNTHDDIVEKGGLTPPAAVSGPPARADVQATLGAGAFDAQMATKLVTDKVAACEQKVNEDPSIRGKVAMHFAVRADGTVKSAVVVREKSSERSPRVLACVLREVSRLSFGATPSHDDVTFEY